MEIVYQLTSEIERLKAEGKTEDEVMSRVKEIMREHNESAWAEIEFRRLLGDAVALS